MSKKTTLEMFKEIKTLEVADSPQMTVEDCLPFMCEKVESELERLEAIDNAKLSEAMKHIDKILEYFGNAQIETMTNILEIKQALITNNCYRTAFELINEKRVDMSILHWAYPSCKSYNMVIRELKNTSRKELTPEEFELIGRLAGAK